MLTRHDIRASLAGERGQTTVNWLVVMVAILAFAGALIVALPGTSGSLEAV